MTEISLTLISLTLIPLFAGVIHSAIGFGFGIVAIAFLPLVIDAKSAHIVTSVCSVPMLIMAAWTYRKGSHKGTLLTSILGGVFAMPLGLLFFEMMSLDLLVRLTGTGVLIMVISSLKPEKSKPAKTRTSQVYLPCISAGFISGFLAGAVSIAGPPIAAFAIRQNWKTSQYKAFVTQFLLVIATSKALLLGFRDHIGSDISSEIVIASISSMIGVRIGEKISRNIPTKILKRLIAGMLITVSILMILRGHQG